MELVFKDVNDAFAVLVEMVLKNQIGTTKTTSRAGDVIAINEPMLITYENPCHRVLFNPLRDCNCFFQLYEALWMLAGRNDVSPLAYYNRRMTEFSDDGKTLNGAYGYRWRTKPRMPWTDLYGASPAKFAEVHCGPVRRVDQLDILVDHLKKTPNSRRAVLQMWDVEDDLLKIDESKDVSCNLSVMFSLRQGRCEVCDDYRGPDQDCPACNSESPTFLDMTVTNRSNDMIWGMLGANVVHFSFLLEYIAARLGASVGRYHQFTNNLHVYTSNWLPRKWLSVYGQYRTMYSPPNTRYEDLASLVPLVVDPERFDRELPEFVERHSKDATGVAYKLNSEPFLQNVAQPLCTAFHYHKRRQYADAMSVVQEILADDWRIVATDWIRKRRSKYESKGNNA